MNVDNKTFKERSARLEEVNVVLQKLDPSIRLEAFSLLKSYVTGGSEHTAASLRGVSNSDSTVIEDSAAEEEIDLADAEPFFTRLETEKPAENVFAIAAFLYSQRGVSAFSTDEVRVIADRVGIAIPARPDKTLEQATRSGKTLFRRTGKGFSPTVHGESFFKATYGVTRVRKQQPTGTEL